VLCQSIMKAEMASPAFAPVYAALVAVVNTKFPEIGALLLARVVGRWKRAYK
jgi:pre-mRNA-splicing factor CWC22